MSESKKVPLSIMMFLQYAVWGIWLPVIGRYLSAPIKDGGLEFTGTQIGMILGLAGSVGAVLAPFIAGQFADRYFSTERFLAVLLFLGGAIKLVTASQTSYGAWLVLSVCYSAVYMPTISLTNSLAFAHLKDPSGDFPYVRVWGTVGWIVAGWVFSIFWLQTNLHFQTLPPFIGGDDVPNVTHKLVDGMRASGIISILYGFFAFMLPHTPPKTDAVEKLAFAKAFALFKRPSFAILVIASLPISMIHQIYFIETGQFLVSKGLKDSLISQVMSIGQFAEIAAMAALGMLLKRLGFKMVIFIGAMAYFTRYAIFGTTSLPLSVMAVAQALHGLCFSCFFAAGFIYVDRLADIDVRHSAQTVFGIIILGGGPVAGGYLGGRLEAAFKLADGSVDFSKLWYTLSAMALVTALLFVAFFRDETVDKVENVVGVGAELATEA